MWPWSTVSWLSDFRLQESATSTSMIATVGGEFHISASCLFHVYQVPVPGTRYGTGSISGTVYRYIYYQVPGTGMGGVYCFCFLLWTSLPVPVLFFVRPAILTLYTVGDRAPVTLVKQNDCNLQVVPGTRVPGTRYSYIPMKVWHLVD